MSCEIEVTLEPAGPVAAGTEVRVLVKAISTEPARCRYVRCAAGWTTSGRGDPDSDHPFKKRVPGEEMQPAVPLEREFRFTVPESGPVTYRGLRFSRGSLINIDWSIRVQLDGSWPTDPEQTVPLVVQPRSI